MVEYNINLDNKTILVTGAAGFIGSFLSKRLCKEYINTAVIGIDNLNDTLKDSYGRIIPKPSHSSKRIQFTSSFKIILKEGVNLFNEIINKNYLVRKITISFHNLIDEDTYNLNKLEQLNLFFDDKLIESEKEEKKLQKVLLSLREKYGKNLVLKGMNLEEGATTIERNNQIGGHKS